MNSIELAATIVGSIFGSSALTAIINNWANKRIIKAEADTATTDNALKWAESLTHRIDKLETALEAVRKENIELHKEVAALRAELAIYKTKQ